MVISNSLKRRMQATRIFVSYDHFPLSSLLAETCHRHACAEHRGATRHGMNSTYPQNFILVLHRSWERKTRFVISINDLTIVRVRTVHENFDIFQFKKTSKRKLQLSLNICKKSDWIRTF